MICFTFDTTTLLGKGTSLVCEMGCCGLRIELTGLSQMYPEHPLAPANNIFIVKNAQLSIQLSKTL